MFYGCQSLIYLDLSGFDLENLKSSNLMFAYCISLIEIKFNNNTSTKNLETMELMFVDCESLESINTKIFRENKLRNLNMFFYIAFL